MSEFVLIGHPVEHSLSPVIHRAAYRALGVSHRYETRDCADEADVRAQLNRLRRGEIAGANVTLPHKRLALALADGADELATAAGAANVWVRRGERVLAHNTDVSALVERFSGLGARRAWVLGAGGAARAAVVALKAVGVESVSVVARDPEAAARLHELGAASLPWSDAALAEAASGVDIVVQATSAGMRGADCGEELARRIPWSKLGEGVLAYDVVYVPAETPFLRAARARGLSSEGGLKMLALQAARAVELWLGRRPPLEPLFEAAAAELGERHES